MKTLTQHMAICAIFSILFIFHNCTPEKSEDPTCSNQSVFHTLNTAEKKLFSDTMYMTSNTDTVPFYSAGKEYFTSVDLLDDPNPLCEGYHTTHEYQLYHLSFNTSLGDRIIISVYNQGSFFRIYLLGEKYEYPLNLIENTSSNLITTYPSMIVHGQEYKNVTEFRGERDSTNKIFINWKFGLVKIDHPKDNLYLERL